MTRKGGPSLFEFIHKDPSSLAGRDARAEKPVIRVVPRAARSEAGETVVQASALEHRPVRLEAGSSKAGSWVHRRFSVSILSGSAVAVAGLTIAVVLTWMIAYQAGRKAESSELMAHLQPPAEPLTNHASDVPIEPEETVPPPERPVEQPAKASASVEAIAVTTDTREPGHNYYRLRTDSRGEAIRAAEFLTAHGVPAMAVPASRANNGGLWIVYARLGIPSGKLRGNPEAQDLEREIARLGKVWKSQEGGSSEFEDAGWELFQR